VETLDRNPEVRTLHDRIAELEAALADACQDLRLTRAWVRLARGQEDPLPGLPPRLARAGLRHSHSSLAVGD